MSNLKRDHNWDFTFNPIGKATHEKSSFGLENPIKAWEETTYDAVSDVVESGVHWRSDFQIGSRVLKISFEPILMHIYGMQYDFMHRSCWNHSNFENSWFYNVISSSDPQNHCLLGSRNRVAVNFFNRYVIYWVVPCERARPELSEYVWQRGVGSLEGRVTAGRSWPFFQEKEEAGVRR